MEKLRVKVGKWYQNHRYKEDLVAQVARRKLSKKKVLVKIKKYRSITPRGKYPKTLELTVITKKRVRNRKLNRFRVR